MTQGNMDLKAAPGSTGHSATHWGSLWPYFEGLIQFPQTLVWKNTLEMAVFTLILGFRPKLRSQNGPENVQNGPGYQVWMSTGGLDAILGHFINFKVSVFNFLKTTISKRYWPHPFIHISQNARIPWPSDSECYIFCSWYIASYYLCVTKRSLEPNWL